MATIVLPAEKVIEACESTIAYIKERRLKENEQMIEEWLKHNQPWSILQWFGVEPPTRETAIKKLTQNVWSFYPSYSSKEQMRHTKRLLKLAQHGDPVTLNEIDTNNIF